MAAGKGCMRLQGGGGMEHERGGRWIGNARADGNGDPLAIGRVVLMEQVGVCDDALVAERIGGDAPDHELRSVAIEAQSRKQALAVRAKLHREITAPPIPHRERAPLVSCPEVPQFQLPRWQLRGQEYG